MACCFGGSLSERFLVWSLLVLFLVVDERLLSFLVGRLALVFLVVCLWEFFNWIALHLLQFLKI